jgi:hypothetical protein
MGALVSAKIKMLVPKKYGGFALLHILNTSRTTNINISVVEVILRAFYYTNDVTLT